MFGGSFRVARLFGIDIEVHPSWFLIIAFLSYSLSEGLFPARYKGWGTGTYWAVGVTAAFLLFFTVLLHELAHALVAKRRGLPVPRITLFIFGGVSHLARQPSSAGEEFQIAAAGPATSFVIAAVTGLAGLLLGSLNEQLEAILYYLAGVNALLGVFNMLPGFPLDGGRVLRSIAWKRSGSFRKATRTAAGVGELFGYLLMTVGFFLLLGGLLLDGLWLMFIGWFLLGAARGEASNLQLEGILRRLTARDVMRTDFPTVVPGLPLQAVVDDYMVGHGERAVIVEHGGAVLGILTVTDIRRVPRTEWPSTPAQAVMTPRERVVTVDASTPAVEVLTLLGEKALNQVPVLENGRMVGLVTRREILDRLQLAESLGANTPAIDEERPAAPTPGA
ncbi:MAG: peptidase M50 [Tepidiforma sp.]|uniref:site-2 protease family protein n=1 Tax=Tepidiforma sp. TaxID=2682230 RepID=UPI0021DDAD21|nr:site-2 protease family protein [Tepidiforma sp.]GIW14719.1 MAG: peptidase M50 [Tepidiforma sp.]